MQSSFTREENPIKNGFLKTCGVLFVLAASLSGNRAIAQDRSTPENTVRSFAEAFASGDLVKACACVQGAKYTESMNDLAKQITKRPVVILFSQMEVKEEGETAKVSAEATMREKSASPDNNSAGNLFTLTLKRTGDLWLIVPDIEAVIHPVAGQKLNALNAIAASLAEGKIYTGARNKALATSCLSNIRQIALAAMIYLQDYDGKFSLKATSYKKSLFPYIKNEPIFQCPSDKSGQISYSFNANLAGRKVARLASPAKTVMLYEGKDGKLTFRHDGSACVAFADGHAKLVTAAEAKSLRWLP